MSSFFREIYCVSNRINSVDEFSICIVILLLDDWIDFILPVYVGVVVWEIRIKINILRIDRMKNIFSNFISFCLEFDYVFVF